MSESCYLEFAKKLTDLWLSMPVERPIITNISVPDCYDSGSDDNEEDVEEQ